VDPKHHRSQLVFASVRSGQERRVDVEEEAVFGALHRSGPAASGHTLRAKIESIDVAIESCRRGVGEPLWEFSILDSQEAEAELVAPASVDSFAARDASLASWARVCDVDVGRWRTLCAQSWEFRVAIGWPHFARGNVDALACFVRARSGNIVPLLSGSERRLALLSCLFPRLRLVREIVKEIGGFGVGGRRPKRLRKSCTSYLCLLVISRGPDDDYCILTTAFVAVKVVV
jgi:hypothetical protein